MNKILEKIDIPKGLIKLLNENPIPKLEEEITDFYFIKPERLKDAQEDYRIDEMTGEDVTGKEKGDWKSEWLVIGVGVADDPLFIDLGEESKEFPIYTAANGAGEWLPYKVSNSIPSFVKILKILNEMVKTQQFDGEEFLAKIDKYTDTLGVWEEEVEMLDEMLLDGMNEVIYAGDE